MAAFLNILPPFLVFQGHYEGLYPSLEKHAGEVVLFNSTCKASPSKGPPPACTGIDWEMHSLGHMRLVCLYVLMFGICLCSYAHVFKCVYVYGVSIGIYLCI